MEKASANRKNAGPAATNAALFAVHDNPAFVQDAVANALKLRKAIVVSEDSGFLPAVPAGQRLSYADAALDRAPVEPADVIVKLKPRATGLASGLVVDVRWAVANMEAVTSLERWGAVAERLSHDWGKPALKLQIDYTTVLMGLGRTLEALDHCLKALAIDPTSEEANTAAMQIFSVQGRDQAIHRQYHQYRQAAASAGEPESAELRAHYRDLTLSPHRIG